MPTAASPIPADYGKALAVFQRHFIVTGPSPFDRYAGGDTSAMDEAAVRGMALFKGKGNCIACHNGPNFTDSGFYNVGLKHNPILDDEAHQKVLKFDAKRTKNADWESITTDPGRYLITHEDSDWGRFKTPTLRNLADTRPTCTTAAIGPWTRSSTTTIAAATTRAIRTRGSSRSA